MELNYNCFPFECSKYIKKLEIKQNPIVLFHRSRYNQKGRNKNKIQLFLFSVFKVYQKGRNGKKFQLFLFYLFKVYRKGRNGNKFQLFSFTCSKYIKKVNYNCSHFKCSRYIKKVETEISFNCFSLLVQGISKRQNQK